LDFFKSHPTVFKHCCYLPSSIFPNVQLHTSKLAGSPKGAEIDPNLPHANKSVTCCSTRILIYIDGLSSVAPNCPSRCYLTFFHIPERSIALVKRLAGSPKGAEIDPNLPHANKVLLQGSTRILIYIDGLFQSHQTVPKPLLSYLLPYSRTFNCTSKTTGSPKELKLIPTCPTLTKVLPKVAHAFLYTLMDFFQSHQPAQAVAILPSSIFLNVQLH
jgi:hypothetical protein